MKSIITLCLTLFFMAGMQNAQAQTKEETIAWIKEKLEKYGGYTSGSSVYTNVNVSPCLISYVEKINDKIYPAHFNPSKAQWTNDVDFAVIADPKVITKTSVGGTTYQALILHIREGESKLRDRMVKALNHLATFCEETKNEAF